MSRPGGGNKSLTAAAANHHQRTYRSLDLRLRARRQQSKGMCGGWPPLSTPPPVQVRHGQPECRTPRQGAGHGAEESRQQRLHRTASASQQKKKNRHLCQHDATPVRDFTCFFSYYARIGSVTGNHNRANGKSVRIASNRRKHNTANRKSA